MDHGIVLYLNQLAASPPLLSGLTIFFAEQFPYLVAAAFAAFVLTRSVSQKERWITLVEGFGAALVSRGVVEVIRFFVSRPRPFVADPSIIPLISEASFSFPSGHAAFFFALSAVAYAHDKRWGAWFFAASAVIGLARVAAGIHYPLDILAGAALGVIVGHALSRAGRRMLEKKEA